MRIISLQPIANQVTTVAVGVGAYTLMFRYFRGLMYATVRAATGEAYVGSVRCADRQWLLPWRRPGYGDGNFRFEDDNGEYPDFRNFGTSCRLVFYSADEIANGEV